MATDSYGQGVGYLDYTDKPDLTLMGKTIVDGLAQRSVLRYSDATSRDATITSPVAGMVAWLGDVDLLTVYDGAAWQTVHHGGVTTADLDDLGSFVSGYSSGARTPTLSKYMDRGREIWEVAGTVNVAPPALPAATTTEIFHFTDPDNWVLAERQFPMGGSNSNHYPIRLGFNAAGAITASVPSAGGAGTTVIWLDCRIVRPRG